jgi:hypothetical protein
MTPLHSTLKRALTIDGRDYVLTLNETALKLTLKGKRNGVELPWTQLVTGEAALAVALHASLGAFAQKDKAPTAKTPVRARPPAKPAEAAMAVGPRNRPRPPKSPRKVRPRRATA